MSDDKHVNWFALEKACEKLGCPLCTIVTERSIRYIDNMLFEHVSDRGFRAQFRAAGGFCSFHAKNLDSFRDGLAVAILCEDILTDSLPAIKQKKPKKYKAICPACEETQKLEIQFLSFIAERTEASFISFFEKSEGLCQPHYNQLLTTTKKIPKWLVEFHIKKFENLLARTRNFIEFSAWGRQADFNSLSEKDKVVWKEIAYALRKS